MAPKKTALTRQAGVCSSLPSLSAADRAALLRHARVGLLRLWAVDRRVGSPRNDGPELLVSIVM
jgi:hypothetical protein